MPWREGERNLSERAPLLPRPSPLPKLQRAVLSHVVKTLVGGQHGEIVADAMLRQEGVIMPTPSPARRHSLCKSAAPNGPLICRKFGH